jgi:hypothetical protein
MSEIENQVAVLRDDELESVTGGIIIIGGKSALGLGTSLLDIHGFNPQPDPPAAQLAL